MANPNPSSIPGREAMIDTFDFMKNLWSGMSIPGLSGMKIPGMAMPTLSVEEINKQIKDLKSVESWLAMNLSMLRSTIQALEVQSATIAAIQSMSASLAEAIKPSVKPDAAAKTEKPGKPAFESPFSGATPKVSTENIGAAVPSGDSAPSVPPMANPAAWWGVLQDQFKHAIDTAAAMAPDMQTTVAKSAPTSKAASTTKTRLPTKSKTAKADKAALAKVPAKRKAEPKT